MKKTVILVLVLILFGLSFSFAQINPSQLERSQEMIEKEEALRSKLENQEKVFINKIIISGSTILPEEDLKDINLAHKRKWLTKDDIQQILELIKQRYETEGYPTDSLKIDYKIKKNNLEVQIEELEHKERS